MSIQQNLHNIKSLKPDDVTLVAVNKQEMKPIADDGLKMPSKSKFIEPKFRSGVTLWV